jgi:DNA-binding CsgD family transcriptional regulator
LVEHREALEDPLLTMSYRYYDAMADRLGALIARENGLSAQELECLGLLALGKTVEEIARICDLRYSTVRSRLRKAERKLAARNRFHAIATAAALGLLDRIH